MAAKRARKPEPSPRPKPAGRRKPAPPVQASAPPPGRKPTEAEYVERVELTRDLLAQGVIKSEIKKVLRQKFGDLDARTIERYLARAREALVTEAADARNYLRAESLAFYRSIAGAGFTKDRDRLTARERIDKLLGLELRVPPAEALCEHLGCTPEQLGAALARIAGGPVPGRGPAAGGEPVPPVPP